MDYQQPQSHYEYQIETHEAAMTQAETELSSRIKQQAFQVMRELDGWCAEHKAGVLIDLIVATRPQTIVEIGVFGGKSLVPMALALKALGKGKAYGIDPWSPVASVVGMDEANKSWWSNLNHDAILGKLVGKINQYNLNDQIQLIRATSKDAAPIKDIDFLHIDGNHSEETSFFDVMKWVPLVKKGGVIVLDDVTWVINGKTSQSKSVKWLDENCKKQAQFFDGCDWAIWIKQ